VLFLQGVLLRCCVVLSVEVLSVEVLDGPLDRSV